MMSSKSVAQDIAEKVREALRQGFTGRNIELAAKLKLNEEGVARSLRALRQTSEAVVLRKLEVTDEWGRIRGWALIWGPGPALTAKGGRSPTLVEFALKHRATNDAIVGAWWPQCVPASHEVRA